MHACLHVPVGPVTRSAREDGVRPGESQQGHLLAAAREFSPRVEAAGPGTVLCDLTGVTRLFGDPRTIAAELRREAAGRGVPARVAVAVTRTAALLVAWARPGITVVDPGDEAAALREFPVRALDALLHLETDRLEAGPMPAGRFYRTSPMEDMARHRSAVRRRATRTRARQSTREAVERHERLLETLDRWGIRTLGDLADLPPADLSARLGQDGPRWQRIARGEDVGPLVPSGIEERFEAHLDLEWPIEGLEPLSFVLGRLLEPIAAHLERRDRAAAVLVVELRLVSRETCTRRIQLPSPIRDARVLRTLALLDLDTHPPGAGVDAVTVRVEPTPGRVTQYSLLERVRPAPESVSTLMARLTALMGEQRCGSPRVPDSFRPGAFVLEPFVADRAAIAAAAAPVVHERPSALRAPCALRRFRQPVPVRVMVEDDRPVAVAGERPGVAAGRVQTCAGPWQTSGEWWNDGWSRDEWDVALDDGTVCRLFHDRGSSGWFIDAVID
jgi:hypothetical protein